MKQSQDQDQHQYGVGHDVEGCKGRGGPPEVKLPDGKFDGKSASVRFDTIQTKVQMENLTVNSQAALSAARIQFQKP